MWRNLLNSERSITLWKSCIVCDEEYEDLCRLITERCDDGHFAIVCSVYGIATQCVFCQAEEYPAFYKAIKSDLTCLLDRCGNEEEKAKSCRALFHRYASLETYRRKLDE